MTTLYLAKGNNIDSDGYASLNGYTMHREQEYNGEWVLRDPNGDYVDKDLFRSLLAWTHGFTLTEKDGAWAQRS